MSNYIYACGDPANARIHVGHLEFISGVKEAVIIEEIKNEHPGCYGIILVNVDNRPHNLESGIDVALDLDGVCDELGIAVYDTSKRRFHGDICHVKVKSRCVP